MKTNTIIVVFILALVAMATLFLVVKTRNPVVEKNDVASSTPPSKNIVEPLVSPAETVLNTNRLFEIKFVDKNPKIDDIDEFIQVIREHLNPRTIPDNVVLKVEFKDEIVIITVPMNLPEGNPNMDWYYDYEFHIGIKTKNILGVGMLEPLNHRDINASRAIQKINDHKRLAYIALNDKDPYMRLHAVLKVNDHKTIEEVAKNTNEEYKIRHYAIQCLGDQNLVYDIAKNDMDDRLRLVAMERLKDKALVIEISENDESAMVRNWAARRIALWENTAVDK